MHAEARRRSITFPGAPRSPTPSPCADWGNAGSYQVGFVALSWHLEVDGVLRLPSPQHTDPLSINCYHDPVSRPPFQIKLVVDNALQVDLRAVQNQPVALLQLLHPILDCIEA